MDRLDEIQEKIREEPYKINSLDLLDSLEETLDKLDEVSEINVRRDPQEVRKLLKRLTYKLHDIICKEA